MAYLEAVQGDFEVVVDNENLAASADNVVYAVAFPHTGIQAIIIRSSTNTRICTNDISSGDPQDEINLIPGQVYVWSLQTDQSQTVCPFSGDVTALYVTNLDAVVGHLQFNVLLITG